MKIKIIALQGLIVSRFSYKTTTRMY
jgi:hypothetical protein